jgi:hypothetical protein
MTAVGRVCSASEGPEKDAVEEPLALAYSAWLAGATTLGVEIIEDCTAFEFDIADAHRSTCFNTPLLGQYRVKESGKPARIRLIEVHPSK